MSCNNCQGAKPRARTYWRDDVIAKAEARTELQAQADDMGVGLGAVFHGLTDWFGIEQCAECKQKEAVLDRTIKLRRFGLTINWDEVRQIIKQRGLLPK